jgi:hypothetical protein
MFVRLLRNLLNRDSTDEVGSNETETRKLVIPDSLVVKPGSGEDGPGLISLNPGKGLPEEYPAPIDPRPIQGGAQSVASQGQPAFCFTLLSAGPARTRREGEADGARSKLVVESPTSESTTVEQFRDSFLAGAA